MSELLRLYVDHVATAAAAAAAVAAAAAAHAGSGNVSRMMIHLRIGILYRIYG